MKMRRLEYSQYGGPQFMRIAEFDLPAPRGREIAVRVAAASINQIDWKLRQGKMKFISGSKFPRAMGCDFSGVVESVGAKVSRFQPGDVVLGNVPMMSGGAFAEKLVTSEKLIAKKPASLSHAHASTLPTAACAAWQALVRRGKLKAGQRVFLNGALGGVGQAALAIAREIGATVTGRVGPGALADAEALGMTPVLDYTKTIPRHLAGSFDVVFDCHGGLSATDSDMLMKPGGVVLDLTPNGPKFLRFLRSWHYKFSLLKLGTPDLQKVAELAGDGRLTISISRTVQFEEAVELISQLEEGARIGGKAVVLFDRVFS